MKNSLRRSCRNASRGSVAILTLWAVLFLALLSLSLSSRVAARLLIASDMKWSPKVRAMGAKALADSVAIVSGDPTEYDSLQDPWANDPTRFQNVAFEGGTYSVLSGEGEGGEGAGVRYGLRDAESRINVNGAPPAVISKLLQVDGGLAPAEADQIADFIVDWRDTNETKERGDGAVKEDCAGAEGMARCKNANYEVMEELLWIPGMTPGLFAKVRGDLTLYGAGTCNVNTASAVSLAAIGLSDSAVSRIVSWREAGRFESPGEISARAAELGLSDEDLAVFRTATSSGLLGTRSEAFEGVVQAKYGDRVRGHVSFVVDRLGKLLEWKE